MSPSPPTEFYYKFTFLSALKLQLTLWFNWITLSVISRSKWLQSKLKFNLESDEQAWSGKIMVTAEGSDGNGKEFRKKFGRYDFLRNWPFRRDFLHPNWRLTNPQYFKVDGDESASRALVHFSIAERSFIMEKNKYGFILSCMDPVSTDPLQHRAQRAQSDGPTLGDLITWMNLTYQFDNVFNWRFANGEHFLDEFSFFLGGGWTGHVSWLRPVLESLQNLATSRLVTWVTSILMFPVRRLDDLLMPGRVRRSNQSYATNTWSKEPVFRESQGRGLLRRPNPDEEYDDTIVNVRVLKEPLGGRAVPAGPSFHSIVTFSTITDHQLGLAFAMEKYDTGIYLTIYDGSLNEYLKRRKKASTTKQYLTLVDPEGEEEYSFDEGMPSQRMWITKKCVGDVFAWLELTSQCKVGYHWRYANCQHFAEELAQFITGWSPPSFIGSLFPNLLNGMRARLSSWSRESLMYWINRYSFGLIRPYTPFQQRLLDWVYRVEPRILQNNPTWTGNVLDPLEEITTWLTVAEGTISDSVIDKKRGDDYPESGYLRRNGFPVLAGIVVSTITFVWHRLLDGWQWQGAPYSWCLELLMTFLPTVGTCYLILLLLRWLFNRKPEILSGEEIYKSLCTMNLQMLRDMPESPQEFFREMTTLVGMDKQEWSKLLNVRGGRVHVVAEPAGPVPVQSNPTDEAKD